MGYFDTIKQKTERQPANVIPLTPGEGGDPYGAAALQREAEAVATAPEGTRNHALNRAAFSLSQLVAAGRLTEDEVRDALTSAARSAGLDDHEIGATLKSGRKAGSELPREVADLPATFTLSEVPSIAPAGAQGPPEGDGDEDGDGEPRGRSSWWPQPLTARAENATAQPAPTHLVRNDGQALMYSGKVNGLLGESESGKSWLAFFAVTQAAEHGQRCLIFDFEDSPAGALGRMTALGLGEPELARIDYADPDEALGAIQAEDLGEALRDGDYQVIVVDGVNAAMTLLGLDLNSNTDATKFATQVLRPLASTGACVITVDHVPKNSEQRGKGGIGAQAKRAMLDGCAITVEVTDPFGRGQSGKLKLRVDKDRAGHVRGVSTEASNPGSAHIDSIGDRVSIHIVQPMTAEQKKDWRPTEKMEAISRELEKAEEPLSQTQIRQLVGGKDEVTKKAIEALREAGHVSVRPGPRNSLMCTLIAPFRADEAAENTTVAHRGPTVAGPGHSDRGPAPASLTGRATVSGIGGHGDRGPTSGPRSEGSDCNQCGERTPAAELNHHGGLCRPCHQRVNGNIK